MHWLQLGSLLYLYSDVHWLQRGSLLYLYSDVHWLQLGSLLYPYSDVHWLQLGSLLYQYSDVHWLQLGSFAIPDVERIIEIVSWLLFAAKNHSIVAIDDSGLQVTEEVCRNIVNIWT